MSILIKGMDMPKSRPVCIVIDAAGQVRRYDLNNDRYADDELFEAVPVQPHGRCIDADALAERMEGLQKQAMADGFDLGAFWYAAFVQHIKLSPAIIQAEEGE